MRCLKIFLLLCEFVASVPNIHKASRKFVSQCLNLEETPFFDQNMVIGRPWRMYYTWNWQLDSPGKCVDLVFRNATKEIINRIYIEMGEYLVSQPPWNDACMAMTMGRESHEMLLFNDMNEGKFMAVPNIVRDSTSITPEKGSVPYLHFSLKILHGGKFLLMLDCNLGIVTLSARSVPYRSELGSVTKSLNLGRGYPVCINERNMDELMGE